MESYIDFDNDSVHDLDFKSWGDGTNKHFWFDNPKSQLDSNAKQSLPPPTKPSDASISPEEAADSQNLGCSVDGKGCWLQNKSYCLIGDCQVPPGVLIVIWIFNKLVINMESIGNTLLDGIN